MQKGIVIFLLLVYSSSSLGVMLDSHYCGEGFAGIAFSTFGGSVDCGCDHTNPTHKGCCKDITVAVKTDNHKVAQQYLWVGFFLEKLISENFLFRKDELISADSASKPTSPAESIRSRIPSINILFCTFRI